MSAAQSNGRTSRGPRVPLATAPPAPEPTPIVAEPVAAQSGGRELMAAILRVTAQLPKLYTNADGNVGGRAYRYADIDAVTDAALPLMVAEQLAWTTWPTTIAGGEPGLRYKMFHVPSGEFEQDVMKLMCAKPDPQGQGSAVTYSRRYALCAVLNITIGDDDGQAASAPFAQPQAEGESPPSQAPQPTAAPAKPSKRPANAAQRTMLETRARAAGLTACKFANVVLVAAGDQEREWMNEEHAENTLARLLDRLPASLVTAVKAGIDGVA
jgi:hypothetical protein